MVIIINVALTSSMAITIIHASQNWGFLHQNRDFNKKISFDIYKILSTFLTSFHSKNIDNTESITQLRTHINLTSIAEKRAKTYKDIENIVKNYSSNKTENMIENLTEAIDVNYKQRMLNLSSVASNAKNKIETITNYNETKPSITKEVDEGNLAKIYNDSNVISNLLSNETALKELSRIQNLADDLSLWEPMYLRRERNNKFGLETRRYQGVSSSMKTFPFMASVHMSGKFACAGAIIRKDLVLTAATCLQATKSSEALQNPSKFTVRVRSTSTEGGDVIQVSGVILNPSFDPTYFTSNLAIVRLKVGLNNKLKKINYGHDDKEKRNPHTISMLGWGATTDITPELLSQTNMTKSNLNACKEHFRHFVKEENFCAKVTVEGACRRDIGSPAISGKTLVGVLSFGPPDCGSYADVPTVFTNISHHIDWIDSIVATTTLPSSSYKLRSVLSDSEHTTNETALVVSPTALDALLNNDYDYYGLDSNDIAMVPSRRALSAAISFIKTLLDHVGLENIAKRDNVFDENLEKYYRRQFEGLLRPKPITPPTVSSKMYKDFAIITKQDIKNSEDITMQNQPLRPTDSAHSNLQIGDGREIAVQNDKKLELDFFSDNYEYDAKEDDNNKMK